MYSETMQRSHECFGLLILAALPSVIGQPAQDLRFDVASIRLSPPVPPTGGVFFGPARGGPGTAEPERISWTYARMKDLLMAAYDVKTYQVNGPGWLDTERYDVAVSVPAGATQAQVNGMWQNLLGERFGLVLHHEPKEFQVYDVTIAKDGLKLKNTAQDPNEPLPSGPPQLKDGALISPGLVLSIFPGPNGTAQFRVMARAQTISALLTRLGGQSNRPMLDKTGLTGKYDFALEYTATLAALPPPPAATPSETQRFDSPSDPGPEFATALEQQLGLKLVPSRASLDVLVIDKLERIPTEN